MQDNDFRLRHDANGAQMLNLKREIDDCRFVLNEKNRHNNEIQKELATNRDLINRKDIEITNT